MIDVYNYGHYVEEAVSSALTQDFPREEREILVVDDGSTDDTAARLRKFGNAIRYLYKSNGGQASAFNYGFANTRRSDCAVGCRRRLAAAEIVANLRNFPTESQAIAAKPSPAQIEHRIAMRAALLSKIQRWHGNGHDLRPADLRAYLMQWKKAQEQDGFAVQAPGRWK